MLKIAIVGHPVHLSIQVSRRGLAWSNTLAPSLCLFVATMLLLITPHVKQAIDPPSLGMTTYAPATAAPQTLPARPRWQILPVAPAAPADRQQPGYTVQLRDR